MLHITTVIGVSTLFPCDLCDHCFVAVVFLIVCFCLFFYNISFGVFSSFVIMVEFKIFPLWANIGDKELMEQLEDLVFSVKWGERQGRQNKLKGE